MAAVAPRDYHVSPDLGPWYPALIRLAQSLSMPNPNSLELIDREVQRVLQQADDESVKPPSDYLLRYAYTLSLILDILHVGGQVRVVDSQIYLSWPDWNSTDGRDATRRALTAVADRRPASEIERRRLSPLFAPTMTTSEVLRFLSEGTFNLVSAEEMHPSGVAYGEAFSLALRTWSMPYRGRQGRMR